MLRDTKYLKYIKHLCWSNKVKQGKVVGAVFMTTRSVFLLLGGAPDLIVTNKALPTLPCFTLFDQHKCFMYFKYFMSVNMMGSHHA